MPQNPPFEGEGFSCSRLYTSRPAIACARRPLCGLGGQSGVAIEPTQSKSERRHVDGATLCTQRASNCTIPHHCSHILCCPAACVQRRRCQTRPSPFALHPTYQVLFQRFGLNRLMCQALNATPLQRIAVAVASSNIRSAAQVYISQQIVFRQRGTQCLG